MIIFEHEDRSSTYDLDGACAFFNERLARGDIRSLAACEPVFSQLANNKSALLGRIRTWLDAALGYSSVQTHVANSYVIGRGSNFVLRLNTWPPLSQNSRFRDRTAELYAYGLPHNHNYSFMTRVVMGGGYLTDTYSWIDVDPTRSQGDQVILRPDGRKSVNQGVTALYERLRDIHIQVPPDSFAVTLNLITVTPEEALEPQFIFDVEKSLIHSIPAFSPLGKQISLLQLGAGSTCDAVRESIERIAGASTMSPCVRQAAVGVLSGKEMQSVLKTPRQMSEPAAL